MLKQRQRLCRACPPRARAIFLLSPSHQKRIQQRIVIATHRTCLRELHIALKKSGARLMREGRLRRGDGGSAGEPCSVIKSEVAAGETLASDVIGLERGVESVAVAEHCAREVAEHALRETLVAERVDMRSS